MTPKLSIGIPTYNQGIYLEKAIVSILNQTEQPFEFIICNNHSTDGLTDEILLKYKNNNIRVISPPSHLGLMANFDYLARQMKGNWAAFLCSDDYYEPNFVKEFYENFDSEAVLHRFGFNWIDGAGRITKTNKIRSVKNVQSFPGNFYEQIRGPKSNFGATVIKMETFKKVDFFDKNIELAGDWGLYLKLSKFGKFRYINKIVGNIRLNYRPNITIERFRLDTADKYYIYSIIQKDIINKYNLNQWLYHNTLKLRLYEMQQTQKKYNTESFKEFKAFEKLVQTHRIGNKIEYLLRSYYQRFNEFFFKR